jgi:hypothetical protein
MPESTLARSQLLPATSDGSRLRKEDLDTSLREKHSGLEA